MYPRPPCVYPALAGDKRQGLTGGELYLYLILSYFIILYLLIYYIIILFIFLYKYYY